MLTLEKLQKELKPYQDTLVIDLALCNIVRLIGVIEEDDDFYWVYDNGKQIEHSSCVMGWTPLKGFIQNKEYNRLVNIWNLNNQEHAK